MYALGSDVGLWRCVGLWNSVGLWDVDILALWWRRILLAEKFVEWKIDGIPGKKRGNP